MIHTNVRVEGFDAASLELLLALVTPDPDPHGEGTVVVVVDAEDRVLSAFHSRRGALAVGGGTPDPKSLAVVHGARRAIVVRDGAFEDLDDRLALRFRPKDDFLAQTVTVAQVLRDLVEAQQLRIWPDPLHGLPLPGTDAVRRAFEFLLPDERTFVLALFDQGALATAVALHRRHGAVDVVMGPARIRRLVGTLTGTSTAITGRSPKPSIARSARSISASTASSTFRRLLRGKQAGRFSEAVLSHELVLEPAPGYATVAVSADALRSVGRAVRKAFSEMDVSEAFGPLATLFGDGTAQGGLAGLLGFARPETLTQILGFDPLRVVSRWLSRHDHEESPRPGSIPPKAE